jgi:hypothetical protein
VETVTRPSRGVTRTNAPIGRRGSDEGGHRVSAPLWQTAPLRCRSPLTRGQWGDRATSAEVTLDQAAHARSFLPSAVRIGGMDRTALSRALRDHGVQLNRAAETLFADRRFPSLSRDAVVEIACVSVVDLGFSEGATYAQLVVGARDKGLFECPLELGPHLRIQFVDQPDAAAGVPTTHGRAPQGSITIASPPLDDADETPKGFYLQRVAAVPWLLGYWSSPGHVWSPEDVIVFARSAPGRSGGLEELRCSQASLADDSRLPSTGREPAAAKS